MTAIMDGSARDAGAIALRALTRAAAIPYALAVRTRLALFASGIRKRHAAPVPVICIGNLTAGGSGKTPLVALVAKLAAAHGHTPGVLSRGYGVKGAANTASHAPNDEARVLAELLPNILHVQNPDRVVGARDLAAKGATLIIMDDGFSHLRLRRNLDILLFDATCPFGHGALLPRGLLREPLSSARRAQLAVITRCDQVEPAALAAIRRRLVELGFSEAGVLHAEHAPVELRDLAGTPRDLSFLKNTPVAAMSGIGQPAAFTTTLASLGARVVAHAALPDHFAYPDQWLRAEWPKLLASFTAKDATAVVITQKDAVKLRGRLLPAPSHPTPPTLPILELRVAMQIREGENRLWQAILRHLPPEATAPRA